MSEIAKVALSLEGNKLQSKVDLLPGAEPKILLMLAHDTLVAAEMKGYLSPGVATARLALQEELTAMGLSHGGSNGHIVV